MVITTRPLNTVPKFDPTLSELLGESRAKPLRPHDWASKRPDELPTQAHRIIAKFGGPRALARLLGYDASQVYRWTYRKDRYSNGTNGVIPEKALRRILKLARVHGVLLTQDDLDPRVKV